LTWFLTWINRYKQANDELGTGYTLGVLAEYLLNDPDLPIITKHSKKQIYDYLQQKGEFWFAKRFVVAFDAWYYEEYYKKRFKTMLTISKDKRNLWK